MCNYQRGTMECRGDGYLWDADDDGYDPNDKDYACPCCNTREFLDNRKESAETVSEGSANGYRYTGESLWLAAVGAAEHWNPNAAAKALQEIGRVDALKSADNEEGFEVVTYIYGHEAASLAQAAQGDMG